MYWADSTKDKIQRADLDGSNVEDFVTSGLSDPSGIALDVAGGKMYWTDVLADKIQRVWLTTCYCILGRLPDAHVLAGIQAMEQAELEAEAQRELARRDEQVEREAE